MNANSWGITENSVASVIKTLLNLPLRVCDRVSPHGCDLKEDPRDEIGKVINVWKEGNFIKARAVVLDQIAKQKISDGIWPNSWSISGRGMLGDDGFAIEFASRSLTLVTNPAWQEARWDVVASENNNKNYFLSTSQFEIGKEPEPKEGDAMDATKEGMSNMTLNVLPLKVTDGSFVISANISGSDNTTANGTECWKNTAGLFIYPYVPAKEPSSNIEQVIHMDDAKMKELEGKIASQEKEIADLKTLVASKDVEIKKMVPQETVEKLISAALADHDAKKQKEVAIAKYKEVAANFGEVSDAEVAKVSILPIEQISLITEKFEAAVKNMSSASQKPVYGAGGSGQNNKTLLTVGAPDAEGKWTDKP